MELNKETFKDMLQELTVENVQEAHKVAGFFLKQLEDEETDKLSHQQKSVFLAALLIEFGKQKAAKKGRAHAADPEGNNERRKSKKPCQCANTDRAKALKTNHGIRAN